MNIKIDKGASRTIDCFNMAWQPVTFLSNIYFSFLKTKMFVVYTSLSLVTSAFDFFFVLQFTSVKIYENAMGKPVWVQNILTKCTP